MFDAFPSFEQSHRIVIEGNVSFTKTYDNFVGWVEVLIEIKKNPKLCVAALFQIC